MRLLNNSFYCFHDISQTIKEIKKAYYEPNEFIKTKYSYLGWHGATIWEQVKNNVFPQISNSERFLEQNFIDIFNDVLLQKQFDIVSLGSGLGNDDFMILDILNEFNKNSQNSAEIVNYYFLDISFYLLYKCSSNLKERINRWDFTDKNPMNAFFINVDLESLKINNVKKEIFDNNNYSKVKEVRKKLFHLLGLTLGNNHEELFLRNISNLMNKGDLLLFDIDCYDLIVQEHLNSFNNSIDEYYKQKYIINEHTIPFLTNSILFLFLYENKNLQDSSIHIPLYSEINVRGQIKFEKTNNEKNIEIVDESFLKYIKLYSEEKKEKGDPLFTNIPLTKTYIRKHEYFFQNNISDSKKVCDYSNKYVSNSFYSFLTENEIFKNLFENRKPSPYSLNNIEYFLLEKK